MLLMAVWRNTWADTGVRWAQSKQERARLKMVS
jgi:hypothetical protein